MATSWPISPGRRETRTTATYSSRCSTSAGQEIQKVRASDDPAYQDTPSAIFADGYYYVAYVSDETGNWDIFVKKYDRNLNLIRDQRLTTSPTDQDSPSLIRVGSDFYLAYQSWGDGLDLRRGHLRRAVQLRLDAVEER